MSYKSKLMLPILAVIAGVAASAFTAANSSYNANSRDASYYWFNTSGAYQDLNTTTNEKDITGCQETSSLCESGYSQDQLVNPNDPSQGVKQGQTPKDQIFRNN